MNYIHFLLGALTIGYFITAHAHPFDNIESGSRIQPLIPQATPQIVAQDGPGVIAAQTPRQISAPENSISYETLSEESNGISTPKHLFGRRVLVKAVRYGELGFVTSAKPAWLAFVCESGDKALVATRNRPRLKPATFYGTTKKADGWEGATLWSLSDCQFADRSAATDSPASGRAANGKQR